MISEDIIDILNKEIFESLNLLELKDYHDQKNYYPSSLAYNVDLSDYNKIDNIVYHGAPLLNFISKAVFDKRYYSLNILNYQGSLAIEKLDKNIFKIIAKHTDLDLIGEFNLINSNVLKGIDYDFFQSIGYSLQSIKIERSYLSEIQYDLFKGLDLSQMVVMSNRITNCDPYFGLKNVSDISKQFWFRGNAIMNEDELKLHEFIKKFKIDKVEINY
ncbi:MAG: hypothetical protein HeimC2_13440 [Candidatus Heimdallarchaeota archaeon LC_2]|nr:MAG: hypothetical protein HeimC2_13440 [Candidatus Heimdallarchaeota archaeon LC_2]